MPRLSKLLIVLVGLTPAAAADEPTPASSAAAKQYADIVKEFNRQGYALRQAKTDSEREQAVERVEKLTRRLLELAEANPKEPAAMDALVQVVIHEIWMENNTPHQVRVIRYKWVGNPGEKALDAALDKLIQEAEKDDK